MLPTTVLLLAPALMPAPVTAQGLRFPAGFEVVEFAGSTLAADIHCMTLDPAGRVVVSGRGYIRLLHDEDGDGRADRVEEFAGAPADGAMGLFWEGDSLYCVGDGGLRVYRNAGGAGRKRPPELLFRCRTGGEHTAHAVARGPDGWLYLLVGDGTGITKAHATLPTSPVKDPIGGCVLRFPPDFRGCEIVADGFRNAYAMDWNADGELFTFDSDNERCVSLPWYEPTRCYHVLPGGHHGWLGPRRVSTWRRPPYFLDVVAPVATLGRGSPTGVVSYRHRQFPDRFHGGLFLLDWTFGQLHLVRPTRRGSSYSGAGELFLKSVGDNGFAPTAAAVHPRSGDLFVAIGGRGTRGAVYRVRFPAGLAAASRAVSAGLPARSLAWQEGDCERLLARSITGDDPTRRRALELVRRHREQFSPEQIEKILRANAGRRDRGVRQAAARLLGDLAAPEQVRIARLLTSPEEKTTHLLARPSLAAVELVSNPRLPAELRLEGVRLVQLALGDLGAADVKGTVWEGYSRRVRTPTVCPSVRAGLRGAFPAGDSDLDRELSRTLAMIEDDDPGTLTRVAARLSAESHPVEDIHYLAVLARLAGPRPAGVRRQVVEALLGLDRKLTQRRLNRDRNWPLRIAELHAGLAARDPRLNEALVGHREFGRPDHALYCRCRGFDRRRAAGLFLRRAAVDESFVWNAELIALVGELPAATALPALRKLWGEQGLDDAILVVLARHAEEADRKRFLTGLVSANRATVGVSLGGVEKLSLPPDVAGRRDEVLALARALAQLAPGKEEDRLRRRLLERLGQLAGTPLVRGETALAWVRREYPAQAARLASGDAVDLAAWRKRLGGIAWERGDARRGERVHVKASCAACHSGGVALGPDLRGVTGRFSRDDLFTAILQPSRDVPSRYRMTRLTTAAGQVYEGILAYEAVDGVLMLTGPGQSVRLAHAQVSERTPTTRSLMPSGLLDRLTDEEISDLYAYLKSLGGR